MTVLFLTDPVQWCVDLVDCLVVLTRRGLWRSARCELRCLGHAGVAPLVGCVAVHAPWGQPCSMPDDPTAKGLTRGWWGMVV